MLLRLRHAHRAPRGLPTLREYAPRAAGTARRNWTAEGCVILTMTRHAPNAADRPDDGLDAARGIVWALILVAAFFWVPLLWWWVK